jgi:hypothetical protein
LGKLTASIQQILQNPQLYVVTQDGKLSSYYRVFNFELQVFDEGNKLNMTFSTSDGHYLTANQIRTISTLERGVKLLFKDIRGTCPECRLFSLPSFTIQVR